jgi:hypothetical protein
MRFLSVKINWKIYNWIVKYNKVLKTTLSDQIYQENSININKGYLIQQHLIIKALWNL